jgi:outer membrane immunogenic protein
MKRYVLASLTALAAVMTMTAANAADLPHRHAMPTKAPAYAVPYVWTGFYLGINGGAGWGRSDVAAPFSTGTFNTSGGLVGGTLGYNYQMGQTVFGLEADGDWTHLNGSATCALTTCQTSNDWLATARGRLGYAVDRFLPYVTAGAAFGDIKTNVTGIGSATDTKAGWTAGGGVEAKIAGPWSAKLEYLYVDLGRGASVLGADSSLHTNLVRAGVNYKF